MQEESKNVPSVNDAEVAAKHLNTLLRFIENKKDSSDKVALDEIEQLKFHLKESIQEKNFWMKKCKSLEDENGVARLSLDSEELVGSARNVDQEEYYNPLSSRRNSRRRTNSELQVMADTIALEGRGIDTETKSPQQLRNSHSSSTNSMENSLVAKSPFRLLQCSDEQCEVFKPRNGSIRTSHHARSNVQLIWDEKPTRVLIIKKPNEPEVTNVLIRVAEYLYTMGLQVYIEPIVYNELNLPCTTTWEDESEWSDLQRGIDFVVCLGGDGTILWVTGMFDSSIPPILSFAMGSLGFLTPFNVDDRIQALSQVYKGGFHLSLRSRLSCQLVKRDSQMDSENIRSLSRQNSLATFHALNEVVIDRGPSAAVVELDCYCDGIFVTRVTADGIIIGTPTGSTAYSLSAGGSMVHPSVPAMLLTPICPHSLSFRPLLFHDSATLKITVPVDSRTSAFVSIDGHNQMELMKGDSMFVKVSSHPVPMICKDNEVEDWFTSVNSNLNWNQRRAQKPHSKIIDA